MKNLNKVGVKELRSDNGIEFRNHKLGEFNDEKGISQNFSSLFTPKQNGIDERRNITLIEAARTLLNNAKISKQFWREAVNTACYTQNRSIIVKRHGKITYYVFKGRSPDISYFYMFGCPMHIYNHRDYLGKFDKKADDGFFLCYSPVAKAFKDDEAISQSSTEGDAINFNENISFLDVEFLEPRSKVTQCPSNIEYFSNILAYENTTPTESPILQDFVSPKDPPKFIEVDDYLALNEFDQPESVDYLESTETQDNVIIDLISDIQPSPITIPASADVIFQTLVPQDKWLREKHIELVNIIGEPLAGIITRSRFRDLDAASTHKCVYVNFLSEMEPKKLIEALEEGWIIAMQEELN
nr:hypothetical protein [Tanacetum cinerariifolium]